jgi:LysR family glycine cleavage system transcriptional activator
MSRHLPSLNALRAFEAAARHLSFTRAAEELNVTQAAISHQVKALEDQLGITLFRRLNRTLLLSTEGQTLFPAVRDALDTLSEATESLAARGAGGTLTVSTLPSFAAKWLVPRMSRFHDRHPEIELRIAATERLVDFARDDVDVAIRFGTGGWPGVRAELVAEEAVTLVCSPSLLGTLRQPSDLANFTLLHEEMLPFDPSPGWNAWLNAAGITNIDTTRGPRFSHTHMILQMAMEGHGVALGGTVLIADDLVAGRLIAPFNIELPSGFAYYLVCPTSAVTRPKIKAFWDWVSEEMAVTRDSLARRSGMNSGSAGGAR